MQSIVVISFGILTCLASITKYFSNKHVENEVIENNQFTRFYPRFMMPTLQNIVIVAGCKQHISQPTSWLSSLIG